MKEIERKFLVNKLPKDLESYKRIEMEQGYLNSSGGPTLRIRKENEEYILCYKSKIESEKCTANVCKEVELPLTEISYNHLKQKIDGKMVVKTRHLIPLDDKLTAELDIFEGYLEGLKMVEVEFKEEKMADQFNPPEWFGKDVSSDYRFRNSYLSGISELSEIL